MCHKNPFNVTLYRVLSCHYICNVFLNYYIAKKQSGGRITQFAIKGYMAICTCGFCKTYPVIVLKECKLIQIVRINFLSVSGLILCKNLLGLVIWHIEFIKLLKNIWASTKILNKSSVDFQTFLMKAWANIFENFLCKIAWICTGLTC